MSLPTVTRNPDFSEPMTVIGGRSNDAASTGHGTAITWHDAVSGHIADPAAAFSLLGRAAMRAPSNAAIRMDIGNILLDRFDFGGAAAAFEVALQIDPAHDDARLGLARCWNRLERYADVLALIDDAAGSRSANSHYLHGMAALGLEQRDLAERDFRLALDEDPKHREAAFQLGRILRDSDRFDAFKILCDNLWAKGARHVQLCLDRGRILAAAGQDDAARALLFTPEKVTQTTLEVPAGFADLDAFNAALADELPGNPYPITDVPTDELAMRGATRIHHLMNGQRPELIQALLAAITAQIDRDVAGRIASASADDSWLQCRPVSAQLRAWGLIQGSGAYEEWHTHRGGWLSGVYYIAIPDEFSTDDDGAGCIELGPPSSLADRYPETLRIAPRSGMLLLMPSHFHHRTIPFVSRGKRISFAFDVRPLD
jgi:tetratricopeptide (TPR) repeat protein